MQEEQRIRILPKTVGARVGQQRGEMRGAKVEEELKMRKLLRQRQAIHRANEEEEAEADPQQTPYKTRETHEVPETHETQEAHETQETHKTVLRGEMHAIKAGEGAKAEEELQKMVRKVAM